VFFAQNSRKFHHFIYKSDTNPAGLYVTLSQDKEKEAIHMIMDGCQGKPRTPTIEDRICPNCGAPIEMFSIDTEMACEKCGFVIYNDKLSCVQWCKYAKQCVGEETYNTLMIIAKRNKEKADAERKARLAAKKQEEQA